MWWQHDSLPWTAQGRSKGSTSDSQLLIDNLSLCQFHILPPCRQILSYFGICPYLVAVLICSQDFMHSSTLLSRSPFLAFTTLNLLSTELKLFSLKALKAVVLTLSCLVSPRFTKLGETLEGLVFLITSLITNQSSPPKCALLCCLRWCVSHVYTHYASFHRRS